MWKCFLNETFPFGLKKDLYLRKPEFPVKSNKKEYKQKMSSITLLRETVSFHRPTHISLQSKEKIKVKKLAEIYFSDIFIQTRKERQTLKS